MRRPCKGVKVGGAVLTTTLALALGGCTPVGQEESTGRRGALLNASGTGSTSWGAARMERAAAIARNATGDVFVAGATTSFGAGTQDALIVKVNASGTGWVRAWGGDGQDFLTAIAVGPDGSLYAAGATMSSGAGSADMLVMKLNSTTGAVLWVKTFGGGAYDAAYDLAFDTVGNLLVAGESYGCGAGCAQAAILMKLTSDGDQLWSKAYKGPATFDAAYSMTTDAAGNVILTGTTWDYRVNPNHNSLLILKADGAGNLLWQRNWLTSGGQDEGVTFHGATTDAAGNVYVAGRHSDTCPGSDGCVYDPLLLKLTPSGALAWARTEPAPGQDSFGSLALDARGRLFVSGVKDASGASQIFVDQFDTSGEPRWRRSRSAPGNGGHSAVSLVLGANQNVFVAGSVANAVGSWTTAVPGAAAMADQLSSDAFETLDATLAVGTPAIGIVSISPVPLDAGVEDTGGGETDVFVAGLAMPASETNVALNPSCPTGFPTPLESDSGWGGGAQPCQIVDGRYSYDTWASGLAFTGGHTDGMETGAPWIEPAGVRHAVIDFGSRKSFHKMTIWWHGVEYTPDVGALESWDDTSGSWISIPNVVRAYGALHEEGTNSGYADSDEYTFPVTTASKVRYTFDNRGHNIVGTWNIHGWIYEVEVFAPEAAPIGAPCADTPGCAEGVCVDGVCCTSACGGGVNDCQACSKDAGGTADGLCTPVTDGRICGTAGACRNAAICLPTSTMCPDDTPVAANTPCDTPPSFCDWIQPTCDQTTLSCSARVSWATNSCKLMSSSTQPTELADVTVTPDGSAPSGVSIAVRKLLAPPTCPSSMPAGFKVSSPAKYWQIETSQPGMTLPATVCINYLPISPTVDPCNLQLFHGDTDTCNWGSPINNSTCKPDGEICGMPGMTCDHPGTICGHVAGFSPFGLFAPDPADIPVVTVPGPLVVAATASSGAVVTFAASAHDAHGGNLDVQCTPASGSTFALGSTTVVCSATDSFAFHGDASFTVRVEVQAPSDGTFFLQPINPDGSSVFKKGSTVPVKFRLTGVSAGITSLTARLFVTKVSSGVAGTSIEADSNAAPDGGQLFRYDASAQQYIFNLSTKGMSAGTFALRADLGDGVDHTVRVSLR